MSRAKIMSQVLRGKHPLPPYVYLQLCVQPVPGSHLPMPSQHLPSPVRSLHPSYNSDIAWHPPCIKLCIRTWTKQCDVQVRNAYRQEEGAVVTWSLASFTSVMGSSFPGSFPLAPQEMSGCFLVSFPVARSSSHPIPSPSENPNKQVLVGILNPGATRSQDRGASWHLENIISGPCQTLLSCLLFGPAYYSISRLPPSGQREE